MKLLTLTDAQGYRVWEEGLRDLTDAQLRVGLDRARDYDGKFFNMPDFRRLCEVTPAQLGLKDARSAYREACNKPFPWDRQHWSHGAVFHAARETGRFELHNLSEQQAFPLFERQYEVMCKRVMAGEDLALPVQKVIAPTNPQYLSRDENKQRCRALLDLIP